MHTHYCDMSSACKVRRGKSEVSVGGDRSRPAAAGLGAGTAPGSTVGCSMCPRALCTPSLGYGATERSRYLPLAQHRGAPEPGEAIPGGWWAPHLLSERPLCGQAAPPTPVPVPGAAGSGAGSASRPLGVRPSSSPSPSSSDTSRISSTVSGKLMRYLSLTGCGNRRQSEQASPYRTAARSSSPHAGALRLHSRNLCPK